MAARACALLAGVCAAGVCAQAQDGIDPMSAPDWLPPLRPPTDGEPAPPLPEVVPGLIILPEKEIDPESTAATDPAAERFDSPAPERADWHTNPKKARDVAREEGKYHIMALLGANWSTNPNPSRLLASEVLNTAEFSRKVGDDYVLSYVDYSQNKNDWSDTHKKLKEYYGVKGFPALVFFDSEGAQIGKLSGYKISAESDERQYLFAVEFDQMIQTDKDAKRRSAGRRAKLAEDGYREWKSSRGSMLFAKLIKANEEVAIFKDEDFRVRKVRLKQLDIAHRELIKRMVRARHVPALAARR